MPRRAEIQPRPLSSDPVYDNVLVTQLVNALVASGGGDLDYSAIGTVLFALSEGAAKSGRG